jgi:hypothetical protein
MKKKTTREQGLEFQRWIRNWLRNRGWDVVNIPPRGIMIKDKKTGEMRYVSLHNDIFGCDLIARKAFIIEHSDDDKEFQLKKVKELWIQATMDRHITRKIDEIKKHPFLGYSPDVETHIWRKVESGKISIYEVHEVEGHPDWLQSRELGRIILGKFYSAEGREYVF